MFDDIKIHDCPGWDLQNDCGMLVSGDDPEAVCKECRFKRAILDAIPYGRWIKRPWHKEKS